MSRQALGSGDNTPYLVGMLVTVGGVYLQPVLEAVDAALTVVARPLPVGVAQVLDYLGCSVARAAQVASLRISASRPTKSWTMSIAGGSIPPNSLPHGDPPCSKLVAIDSNLLASGD